jgi:hypothetical protein
MCWRQKEPDSNATIEVSVRRLLQQDEPDIHMEFLVSKREAK